MITPSPHKASPDHARPRDSLIGTCAARILDWRVTCTVCRHDGRGCERFEGIRFLIRDRGSNFTASFDAVCERLVGTLRRELLDRVLILGEAHLRSMLAEYQVHYNTARPHQGIAQRVPDSEHDGGHLAVADLDGGPIHRKPVLGGLINEYSRAA